MKTLDLSGNNIGNLGIFHLSYSESLKNLEVLRLGAGTQEGYEYGPFNKVGDMGVAKLVNSPVARNLKILDLGHNQVGDEGAVALAASLYLENLEELNLCDNRLTEKGIEALISSLNLPKLQAIGLSNNHIPLKRETYYDWDGSIAGGEFNRNEADRLKALFTQHPHIY